VTSCEEELAAYVSALRTRQLHARYPLLLRRDGLGEGVLRWKRHAGIGLVSVAIRQSALDGRQREALGEFRLHQYLLCGLYDAAYAMRHGLLTDPALASIPGGTVHVLVGADDAKLLAYFCIQPAADSAVEPSGAFGDSSATLPLSGHAVRMRDAGRPLLPTELELFGGTLYSALPGFGELLVSEVRELSSLIANQTLRSSLTLAAIVEAFQTMGSLVTDPAFGTRALVSHVDLEARRIVARLGMPTMYAPLAPVVVEPRDDYWNAAVNAQGAFWPNLTATDDLYRHAAHFQRAEEALESPTPEFRQALIAILKHPLVTEPRVFMPRPGDGAVRWTSDPDGGIVGVEAAVGASARRNAAAR
jgi:hypothetical protein